MRLGDSPSSKALPSSNICASQCQRVHAIAVLRDDAHLSAALARVYGVLGLHGRFGGGRLHGGRGLRCAVLVVGVERRQRHCLAAQLSNKHPEGREMELAMHQGRRGDWRWAVVRDGRRRHVSGVGRSAVGGRYAVSVSVGVRERLGGSRSLVCLSLCPAVCSSV